MNRKMGFWRLGVAVSLGIAGFGVLPAWAEHFDIHLSVHSEKGTATAGWDTYPPEGGFNPRPLLGASVGEDLLLEWDITSTYPHGTMKKVRVHIFAAAEEKPGQKKEPSAGAPHLFDNSFTMDFLPDHTARGHFRFRVMQPGVYLVRLQSESTIPEHDHEHFAAVDLKVSQP